MSATDIFFLSLFFFFLHDSPRVLFTRTEAYRFVTSGLRKTGNTVYDFGVAAENVTAEATEVRLLLLLPLLFLLLLLLCSCCCYCCCCSCKFCPTDRPRDRVRSLKYRRPAVRFRVRVELSLIHI